MASIYEHQVKTIDDRDTTLKEYEGKVLLIVNTASKCGFTPQFEGLERLYETYRDKGFVVLGFPCNQFGGQDPGSDQEIGAFCRKNYGVSFPMHSKIEVNGAGAHPLFVELKEKAPGILGSKAIKWNFTKFLVDRQGRVLERFAPNTKPEELKKKIEALL